LNAAMAQIYPPEALKTPYLVPTYTNTPTFTWFNGYPVGQPSPPPTISSRPLSLTPSSPAAGSDATRLFHSARPTAMQSDDHLIRLPPTFHSCPISLPLPPPRAPRNRRADQQLPRPPRLTLIHPSAVPPPDSAPAPKSPMSALPAPGPWAFDHSTSPDPSPLTNPTGPYRLPL
jgi:hypothetical protein